MIPSKSILLPKESKVIKCVLNTLNLPTSFQITVPCGILDIAKRKKHLISLENFKLNEEKSKFEFTITEHNYIQKVSFRNNTRQAKSIEFLY